MSNTEDKNKSEHPIVFHQLKSARFGILHGNGETQWFEESEVRDVQMAIGKRVQQSIDNGIAEAFCVPVKSEPVKKFNTSELRPSFVYGYGYYGYKNDDGKVVAKLDVEAYERALAAICPVQKFKNNIMDELKKLPLHPDNIERCYIAIRSKQFDERWKNLTAAQWADTETIIQFLLGIYREITNG